ncbi:unnamed protein product, partial [Ectocarpus sp. 12 AP-2014]
VLTAGYIWNISNAKTGEAPPGNLASRDEFLPCHDWLHSGGAPLAPPAAGATSAVPFAPTIPPPFFARNASVLPLLPPPPPPDSSLTALALASLSWSMIDCGFSYEMINVLPPLWDIFALE